MARVSAEHKFIFVNKVDSLIVTFVGVRFNIKIPSYG